MNSCTDDNINEAITLFLQLDKTQRKSVYKRLGLILQTNINIGIENEVTGTSSISSGDKIIQAIPKLFQDNIIRFEHNPTQLRTNMFTLLKEFCKQNIINIIEFKTLLTQANANLHTRSHTRMRNILPSRLTGGKRKSRRARTLKKRKQRHTRRRVQNRK